MGCVCCSLGSFVSLILDALERTTLCTVCALLTTCFYITIVTVLVVGVGIGYHYCFIKTTVEAMETAAKHSGLVRRSGSEPDTGKILRSVDKGFNRGGFAHRLSPRNRRDAFGLRLTHNNTFNSIYRLGAMLFNNTISSTDYDKLHNNRNVTLSDNKKLVSESALFRGDSILDIGTKYKLNNVTKFTTAT